MEGGGEQPDAGQITSTSTMIGGTLALLAFSVRTVTARSAKEAIPARCGGRL